MIKVYTKDDCSFCITVKNYLKALQIQFEEINVQENDSARAFLKEHGHRSVPQIYIDEHQYIVGGCDALLSMRKEEIDQLIGEIYVNQ